MAHRGTGGVKPHRAKSHSSLLFSSSLLSLFFPFICSLLILVLYPLLPSFLTHPYLPLLPSLWWGPCKTNRSKWTSNWVLTSSDAPHSTVHGTQTAPQQQLQRWEQCICKTGQSLVDKVFLNSRTSISNNAIFRMIPIPPREDKERVRGGKWGGWGGEGRE